MQIAADKLTLKYQAHPLFENLSFNASAGQRICIAGPSGSGKSSLLRALMGFVRPASGSIFIDGIELNDKTVWKLRRLMAYVPQEPDLGDVTVKERISRPFHLKANAHLVLDSAELDRCWTLFGLGSNLLEKKATELSGGEKQRVAVIIALLLKRPVLLLDEPVSAMDKQSRLTLREVLKNQTDKTILFVSHDDSLLDIADRIVDVQSFRSPS
jgi:putative ABC transport system ATP-binding protein